MLLTRIAFQACSIDHSDISPLALGPHPQRELTLMPRLGFSLLGSAWPQALLRFRINELRAISISIVAETPFNS
jgi:hypothetical protein